MAQDNELQLALKIEADASIDNAAQKLDKVAESARKIERVGLAFDDIGESARQAGDAMTSAILDAEEAQRKLAQQAKKTNDVLDEQGKKSGSAGNGLDAAGQFAGGAGQVGGALEDLGLQGAGRVGQIGAAIGDVTENIPKLAEAAKGLPGAIGSAASALGPAGILVVGVAAGAAALVALWKHSIKEMEKDLQAFAQASASFVDFAGGGGTVEDAEKLNREEARRMEFAQKEIVRLREEYAQREFNVLDRLGNDGEQALVDQIKKFETDIDNAEANIERRNEAITNDELPHAVKEATKAIEEQVTAQRELSGAVTKTAREISSQSEGFNRRRADSARNRSAGTLSFGFLSGQSGSGTESNTDMNEIDKQLRDVQNNIIEVNNDFEEKRVQQVIDNNRRLQDIARDFGDSRVDAFEEGNFLALSQINKDESRAKRDQSTANQRANQDRAREQQNSLRNLQQQEQQFHQQRLQLNQQGFQTALNQQQQFINAFIGNFSNMFSALSGRSSVRRTATP